MDTNSMTRTRLFIGLKTDSNNKSITPEAVKSEISKHVDAGTFYETEGLWMDELEDSMVFECMGIEDHFKSESGAVDSVEALKSLLEKMFDQDSVMVEREQVEVVF